MAGLEYLSLFFQSSQNETPPFGISVKEAGKRHTVDKVRRIGWAENDEQLDDE